MKIKVKDKVVYRILKVNEISVRPKAIGTLGGETKFSNQVLLISIDTNKEIYELSLKRDDSPYLFSLEDCFIELVLSIVHRMLSEEVVSIDDLKARLVIELENVAK